MLYPQQNDVRNLLDLSTEKHAFEQVRQHVDRLKSDFKTIISDKNTVIQLFYNTVISKALTLYSSMEQNINYWSDESLSPLIQHSLYQKQLLEQQLGSEGKLQPGLSDNPDSPGDQKLSDQPNHGKGEGDNDQGEQAAPEGVDADLLQPFGEAAVMMFEDLHLFDKLPDPPPDPVSVQMYVPHG